VIHTFKKFALSRKLSRQVSCVIRLALELLGASSITLGENRPVETTASLKGFSPLLSLPGRLVPDGSSFTQSLLCIQTGQYHRVTVSATAPECLQIDNDGDQCNRCNHHAQANSGPQWDTPQSSIHAYRLLREVLAARAAF
jgi:hypothetical protein